jgi:hypothetical protein
VLTLHSYDDWNFQGMASSHGQTKLYIEQFDDANGVIREPKSKKDRQCHGHSKLYIEQFDDTTGTIRGRKSKKERQLASSNCSISTIVLSVFVLLSIFRYSY